MKRIIYVTDFGQSIKQKKNRIVVVSKDSSKEYVVDEILEIVIMGKGKSVTVDAIRLCVEKKIPIFFAYANGYPYAAILPMIITGTVKRKRAQYIAYNSKLGVEIAKKFIVGKLSNQRNLLRFWAKSRAQISPELANELKKAARKINDLLNELKNVTDDSMNSYVRMRLMSIESKAADIYWSCFKLLLKKYVDFPGRVKPNANDPVNALLNLGYGILARKVFIAILFAGLDPYAGFLHSDKSGKKSLVFDLMEEFRQQVVDRLVMKMFTKKIINPKDCMENGKIRDDVCKHVIKLFEERFEEKVTNIYGEKRTINEHIHYQARHLGRVLIGVDPEYKPFILPW